jgi:hypothetical protein
MYAIEFEADIENNVISLPVDYQNLNQAHVRVILLTQTLHHAGTFNPRDFFGAGIQSKQACDTYLADVREGWK